MALHSFSVNHQKIKPEFITLGRLLDHLPETQIESVRKKVDGISRRKVEASWATLGWANDEEFNPKGDIFFSREGNDRSVAKVTLDEIRNIYDFNNELDGTIEVVKERYINFDKVDFELNDTYHINEIPELRLTLFMNKNEGAIVYYQHCDKNKFHDSEDPKKADPKAEVEYILPNEAETGRDRLTYIFPVIPPAVEEVEGDPERIRILKEDSKTSFIVKILTFKRTAKTDKNLIKGVIDNLNAKNIIENGAHRLFGDKKYGLLKFNAASNDFTTITHSQIDFGKKTLLLIHGTFSTIKGSYGATYLSTYSPQNVVLQELITNGTFEQIVGFNHPTITHGAVDNAKRLYKMLGRNNRFAQPVHLMGTSRGALVCKQLANDPNNKHFEVSCVLTFSGANGVGYFTAGKYLVKLFSVWKKAAGPGGKIIAAFAQFSAQRFLNMPGCQVMTPNSPSLNAILNANPHNSFTTYQCVGADWHRKVQRNRWKRIPAILLDAALKLILGRKHDWVVNTNNQLIAPSGYKKPDIHIQAMHTKVLENGYVRGRKPHTIMKQTFRNC